MATVLAMVDDADQQHAEGEREVSAFMWRAWFFFGLGGVLTTVTVLFALGTLPPVAVRVYGIFSLAGFAQGLLRIVLFNWNPFAFYQYTSTTRGKESDE